MRIEAIAGMGASDEFRLSGVFELTEWLTRGQQAAQACRFEEGRQAYAQALELEPTSLDALRGLGYVLLQLKRLAESLDAVERALRVDPSDLLSLMLMGRLCLRLHQPALAETRFRQILQRIPNSEAAHSGLIDAHVALGGLQEARALCAQVLASNPVSEVGHLAAARLDAYELQDERALSHFDVLLRLRPDHPAHRYNRSLCLLRLGRHQEGWRDYEQRFAAGAVHLDWPATPRWDGGPVRHLLVLAEQGLGDAILFARFLREAAARCERLTFACADSLAGLIGRSLGIECVPEDPLQRPPHDAHLPLMSLPLVLQVPDATAARPAYLSCDPLRRAQWSAALGPSPGSAPRIGLVHATSVAHSTEENPFTRRSCAAADLLALVQGTGFEVYNLNLGRAAEAARSELPGLRELQRPIENFDDTAAVFGLLDAVVSVDTAAAHLAGAVGAPLQLLLPPSPDWKWQARVAPAPWYETARLAQRASGAGWAATVALVAERLQRTLRVPAAGR
jgi:tetratricopeptide (TPR) repeat protein